MPVRPRFGRTMRANTITLIMVAILAALVVLKLAGKIPYSLQIVNTAESMKIARQPGNIQQPGAELKSPTYPPAETRIIYEQQPQLKESMKIARQPGNIQEPGAELKSPTHAPAETRKIYQQRPRPKDPPPRNITDLDLIRNYGETRTLADLDFDKLSIEELRVVIHSYLDNSEEICHRKLRMGKLGDGGWEICDDEDVRPVPPCLIHSYGIHYDFTFDDDAALVYGCHVHSFDPSMDKVEQNYDRSPLVHFHKIGLSGTSQTIAENGWQLYTYSDIKAKLGQTNISVDLIKMDIEGSEWSALPNMLSNGQLKGVRQLLIEYHTAYRRDQLIIRLKAIKQVEMAGFRRFYVHKNPACGTKVPGFPIWRAKCYEIHYLRR